MMILNIRRKSRAVAYMWDGEIDNLTDFLEKATATAGVTTIRHNIKGCTLKNELIVEDTVQKVKQCRCISACAHNKNTILYPLGTYLVVESGQNNVKFLTSDTLEHVWEEV